MNPYLNQALRYTFGSIIIMLLGDLFYDFYQGSKEGFYRYLLLVLSGMYVYTYPKP